MSGGDSKYVWRLLVVLAGLTLLRGVFAAVVELCPDEAYYFAWSRSPDWGYYDHGPLVAWLIGLGTFFLGDNELGVRLGALLCSLPTAWVMFLLVREITSDARRAFWVAVAVSVCPLFATGAVIHTPDAALVAAWSAATWFSLKAYQTRKAVWWVAVGAMVGVSGLAKMSGFLFLPGLALFFCLCKTGRERLKGPGPALAFLCAACVAAPNLWWNAVNEGGSFAFQLRHAIGGPAFLPAGLLSFLGGQAGVITPLLWFWLVTFMLVGWRRSVRFGRAEVFMLWCLSAPLFAGFVLLAMVHKVEANWPAVAYLAAVPGAVWAWTGGQWYLRRRRLFFAIGAGLALLVTLVVHLQVLVPWLPLGHGKDPTARLRGWRELANEVTIESERLDVALAAEGYGPVSELRFYTGKHVIYERSSIRLSQYDFWPVERPAYERIIFLQPRTTSGAPGLCKGAGERWMIIKEEEKTDRGRLDEFRWWVCEAYSPGGGR